MTDDNNQENDDWLDDFDEEVGDLEVPAELDQESLDELFGDAATADTSEAAAPVADVEEDFSSLDQSSIDDLLGDDTAPVAAAPAPASDGEEDVGSIDQSSIDDLLGGGDAPVAAAAPVGEAQEAAEDVGSIDQSSIDDLLGGDSAPAAAAPASENKADFSQLDQSALDDLIASDDIAEAAAPVEPVQAAAPPPSEDTQPGKDDDLYSEIEDEAAPEPVKAAPAPEGDEAGDEDSADAWGFDVDDFDLDDDIADIPDEGGEVPETALPPSEDTFSDESTGIAEAIPGLIADTVREVPASATISGKSKPFMVLGKSVSRLMAGIAALCLLLVVGGGGTLYYVLRQANQDLPAIVLPQQGPELTTTQAPPTQPESTPPVKVAAATTPTALQSAASPGKKINNVPIASSARYMMQEAGENVALMLIGNDQDGDSLQYEISTAPKYGRISGTPPEITYLPGKDFPGEDRFEFQVSDGTEASLPAIVQIGGPALTPPVKAVAKVIKPRRPIIHANNTKLNTKSTEAAVINFKKLWQEANSTPFTNRVKVELNPQDLHGKLTKISKYEYRYDPDPYWNGVEEIKYRFKKGGITSKLKEVKLDIAQGEAPPNIKFTAMGRREYAVGETVILDASQSKDEERDTLVFTWEQIDGVPILLSAQNAEASIVSFIMPSSFYTIAYPEPVLKVSVTDASGQVASQEIQIPVARGTRIQSAKWSGLQAAPGYTNGDCPKGYCPDNLLPWSLEE